MATRIHTIPTHEGPHTDEYLAILLLKKYGEEKFPGVSTAKIVYWRQGGGTPDGRPIGEYEREGYLPVGTGGGMFDEHPTLDEERIKGECCATLVAKALGIRDDPALKKILKFVLNDDLKGSSQPFAITYISKLMHQQYPNEPEKVMDWVMAGLEAKIYEQAQFFNVTKKDFDENAVVEEIDGSRGAKLKLVTIESDDSQMSKLARSTLGCNASIVIQKRSSGNVTIHTSQKYDLNMYDTVKIIRMKEQLAKGIVKTTDFKELSSEGKVDGAEEWFFFEKGQMLLNGSLTATDVPSTNLSLNEIKESVKIGMNPYLFHPDNADACRKGACVRKECSLYKYGLSRCRKVCFEMRKKVVQCV